MEPRETSTKYIEDSHQNKRSLTSRSCTKNLEWFGENA
uniref:Uncharacterized protein n=1 Tax=Arundo donax TaxID=35708 RepID=A0A0A9M5A8_ARUDO